MSSGKVKCTCGWSWNKSDSSKKDMYICHECGRDNSNNMKNGGWLDSYADGGTMQEHQENYNNSEVSLPEGFVGMGNNTKGRNYSPAWGGQFQMGGNIYPVNYVPQAQEGKELTFLQPTSDKLPEGYVIPYNTPSSERAMSIGGENGEPAYLIPSFKYGKPLYDPIGEFRKTKEHLGGPFKTYQEADEWERTVRHPAVERKETIMFPQEKFAMGGSIPGAVGFSYARVGAPSKGPRRNQTDVTDASAQNGKEMKYYQEGLDFKPKSISKNGGWLSKYDVAQAGAQVQYGTPEYEEAYNRGEVITDEGVRSPILLDEVIVKGKKRKKGFWEQSRDAYIKEHQDDGILGAIGSVATYPLGLAQQAMMYGLTGKVQRPSEVIGFENNERWFANPSSFGKNLSNLALDVVTDPVNLIGAGILTKENALSKLSKLKPKQNYTLPEIPSELNLNVNQRGLNLERTTPKSSKKLLPQWTERQLDSGLIEQTPLRKGINKEVVKQVVVPGKGEIALKTTLDSSGNPVYYFSANVAEGGLSAGKAFKHLEQFIPKGSKILENKSLSTDSFYNVMQRAKNTKQFTWVNEEQFLPLNNAGKNKMFSNSDKIVPGATNVKFEDYNQAVKALNEFNSRITIEGMPKAKLSKIVDDFQPVKDGPWIKKTTFGIDVPNIGLIKEYKQGGIIDSDRGQWDHPGEITRISGSNITMKKDPRTGKALTEPLLGIADTGEQQWMYPGEDYNFEGASYVTEIPKRKLAKNGLRQEQKGLVNLDQLTNFTNYNTKQPGGWLDTL